MNLRLEIREIVESILSEGKNPLEVVDYYLKSQPDLIRKLKSKNNALLKKLTSLDFEYNPEKFEVGKIFPWLLNLWKKNDPDLINLLNQSENSEAVIKFKNFQKLFNQPKFKKSIQISDINKFKSISDFVNRVNQAFVESNQIPAISSFSIEEINQDIRDGIIMKTNLSNDNYFVITPLKKKGACKYGNTHIGPDEGRWCTAKEENNAFDSYKDGILYIFMDKRDNLKSKFQFYYKENNFQFQNEFNRSFDHSKFFEENLDIFKKLFPKIVNKIEGMGDEDIQITKQILEYLPKQYREIYLNNIEKYATGFLADLLKITKGEIDPEEYFSNGEKIGFENSGFQVDKDKIIIDCELEDLNSTYRSYADANKYGYEYYQFDSYEFNYLHNWIKDGDRQKWFNILRIFDMNFDESKFEEESYIYEIISETHAYNYFRDLLNNFEGNYENAKNQGQEKWIDKSMEKLPFELERNAITVYFKKAIQYCLSNNIVIINNIWDIIEGGMDEEGLNEDNLWGGDDSADYSKLENDLSNDIDEVLESIQDDEDFEGVSENSKKFVRMLKDLKFERVYNGYELDNEKINILIKQIDYNEGKIVINYKNKKNNKEYNGWIELDSLPRYATMEMMFEGNYLLRNQVRKIVKDLY